MATPKKIAIFSLRILLGALMLYAGVTKVFDPSWSAAGYLQNAKTFHSFYEFMSSDAILPIINIVNSWGLTLLGISLLSGMFIKVASYLGAGLMFLYYFPVLEFPYIPGAHAFIVDEHIIYAACLILLGIFDAGKIWGLDQINSKIIAGFGRDAEEIKKDVESIGSGLDLIGEHMIITDPDGMILYANRAVQENTGFSLEEVIGKSPGILWGGNMPKEFYKSMWHTLKDNKRLFIGEVKNKKKNGEEYWQQLIIIPVLDPVGKIRFFIGIEPDITERKKMEAGMKKGFHSFKDFNNFILNDQVELSHLKDRIEELKRKLAN